MKTFVMKAEGELTYAYFMVDREAAHITALIGASAYIDSTASLAQARKTWRMLRQMGFKRVPLAQARAAMPLARLKMLIHD